MKLELTREIVESPSFTELQCICCGSTHGALMMRTVCRDWLALEPEVARLQAELAECKSLITSHFGMPPKSCRYEAEVQRLRKALQELPLSEYHSAMQQGCDAGGAWDCMRDAVQGHVKKALEEKT